ncbi:MAG: hypothetical protein Q4B80_00180 [Aerococcaceae bacterium]|nr:hypothetical protein [Aerococcaceae bacterium]
MENMVNSAIHRMYYWLKLSTIFVMCVLAGAILFGAMAAITTVVDLHATANGNAQALSFSKSWQQFRNYLSKSYGSSLFYEGILLFLGWLLWFTSQFKGVMFLLALSVQVTFFIAVLLAFLAEARLRYYYSAGRFQDFVKLAFIQLATCPKANVGTLLYGGLSLVVLSQYPAVVFFFGVAVWENVFHTLYRDEWIARGLITYEN